MSIRVLVVHGDADERATLVASLSNENFGVASAPNAKAACEICSSSQPPQLVLISSTLPDMPGVELCRELRQTEWTSRLPVIILSEEREDIDLVVAFELGADDYLAHPFPIRELVLRIRALVRRCYPEDIAIRDVRSGTLRLDRAAHRAWNGDTAVVLTKIEFRLLEVLMERRGRGQSREQLLLDVWGRSGDNTLRTVDTHVRRLRAKLGSEGRLIRTVRGLGYCFGQETSTEELPDSMYGVSPSVHRTETKL